MLRKSFACLLASGLVATMASGQTAGELIAKNNQAQGGNKLRSVKTARVIGKLTVAGTEGGPLLMEFVPPSHKVRMEVTEKGVVDISAYDGAIAWELKRSADRKEPERLTGDALKDMKDMADFQGSLFDYEAKGNEIEVLGKVEIDGNPAYKLKLTKRDGEESTVYLDAKTYLEIKEETIHAGRGERTELVSTYSNFKTFDGVTLPCTIETRSKQELGGGTIRMEGSMRIDIEKVEINVDIPASRFTRPQS